MKSCGPQLAGSRQPAPQRAATGVAGAGPAAWRASGVWPLWPALVDIHAASSASATLRLKPPPFRALGATTTTFPSHNLDHITAASWATPTRACCSWRMRARPTGARPWHGTDAAAAAPTPDTAAGITAATSAAYLFLPGLDLGDDDAKLLLQDSAPEPQRPTKGPTTGASLLLPRRQQQQQCQRSVGGDATRPGGPQRPPDASLQRPTLLPCVRPSKANGGGVGSEAAAAAASASQPPPKRKSRPTPQPLFSDDDPWVTAAYDGLAVMVTGRAPPVPLLSYNELARGPRKVAKLLLANVAAAFRLGRPTPIQSHLIPAMMDGRDVLAVSCPGSGKTLAYLLPLLAQLMGRNRLGSKNMAAPEAVVLVPTRELAEQVFSDVQVLLRGSHLKAMVVRGGVSLADQVLSIRGRWHRSAGGADLVVATPGRLLQLVEQRRAVRLSRLGLLVVDEADRLMDLGMWPDLRRLLSQPGLPTARQTVLVAASLPLGGQMEGAARELLTDQLVVAVGDGSGTSGVVRQNIERVSDEEKLPRLLELLAPGAGLGVNRRFLTTPAPGGAGAAASAAPAEPAASPSPTPNPSRIPSPSPSPGGPAVVFTRSLARAEKVAQQLAAKGVSVALLHRDLTQDQRDEAMQCFRFGVASVLVATALASRGLNFPDVAHVVNYDVPISASVYFHQVGRTGRGGRPGVATTFVTPSNRPSAPWLLDCLRRAGSPVPPWLEEMASDARAKVAALRAAAAAAAAASATASGAREPDGGARPGRRRTAVALDDPAAATTVKFGTYLTPRAGQVGMGTLQQRGMGSAGEGPAAGAGRPASAAEGPPLPPLQPVVLDRRHDASYWQAVFESALQPQPEGSTAPEPSGAAAAAAVAPPLPCGALGLGGTAAAKPRHRRGGGGSRQLAVRQGNSAGSSRRRADGVRAHVADVDKTPVDLTLTHGSVSGRRPASAAPGEFRGRRLVYRDRAVKVEMHPGGGLTAGPQRRE